MASDSVDKSAGEDTIIRVRNDGEKDNETCGVKYAFVRNYGIHSLYLLHHHKLCLLENFNETFGRCFFVRKPRLTTLMK